VKYKLAPPFREVEFDILYGHGISHTGDVIDLATEANIVEKSGAWFSYQGERIGQGRENARTYLEQHTPLLDKIETAVLAQYGIARGGKSDAPAPAPAPAKGKDVREAPAGGGAPASDGKRATPPKAN
jgi:recombination protein RecA